MATLDEKVKALTEKIATLQSDIDGLNKGIKDLLDKDEATQEDLDNAKDMQEQARSKEQEIAEIRSNIELYETAKRGKEVGKETRVNNNTEEKSVRQRLTDFIRSKGNLTDGLTTDGKDVIVPMSELRADDGKVKSADASPVIPVENITTPQLEVKTVVDLKPFTNVQKVTTGSGTYPILKSTNAVMHTVEELEKNPNLAKPEFEKVDWKVQMYRASLAISQESLDDSAIDLAGLVANHAQRVKLNTQNKAIADVMKTFTAVAANTADDIKEVLNKKLDPGYNKAMVVSQTFYHELDTMKDKNDHYLLQPDFTSASGYSVFGVPVFVLADDVIGTADTATAFIGDIKAAILNADRADLAVRWVDNDIYGQLLSVGVRFDIKAADKKAGFYVTLAKKA